MREQQSIQYPAWYEEIALLRAKLHAAPELGHCEVMTTQLIKERLRAYGVEVLPFDLPTGVVGRLRRSQVSAMLADMISTPPLFWAARNNLHSSARLYKGQYCLFSNVRKKPSTERARCFPKEFFRMNLPMHWWDFIAPRHYLLAKLVCSAAWQTQVVM